MTIKSKIWIGIGVLVLLVLGAQYTSEDGLLGFGTNRGFSTLPVTDPPAKTSYIFGVVDVPTDRAGAASSSTDRERWRGGACARLGALVLEVGPFGQVLDGPIGIF